MTCPTGSGRHLTRFEVAQEISRRLTGTFLRDAEGRRPVYGGSAKFQEAPHGPDLILFYEYFHGDNGAGLGASHQTGWTGLVAPLLDLFGRVDAKDLLETERTRLAARLVREQVGGEATGGRQRLSPWDARVTRTTPRTTETAMICSPAACTWICVPGRPPFTPCPEGSLAQTEKLDSEGATAR